jgi:hypothetical protein
MVPTIDNNINKSEEVKEVMKGMKNNQPAATDRLF